MLKNIRWFFFPINLFVIIACGAIPPDTTLLSNVEISIVRDERMEGKLIGSEEDRWRAEVLNNGIGVNIDNIEFLDGFQVVGSGEDNKIYRTHDGLKKWRRQDLNIPADWYISSLSFIDDNGIVSVINRSSDILNIEEIRSKILFTSDAGKTWNEELSITQAEISRVVASYGFKFWAAGRRFPRAENVGYPALLFSRSPAGTWTEIPFLRDNRRIDNVGIGQNRDLIVVAEEGTVLSLDEKGHWDTKGSIAPLRQPQIGISTIGTSANGAMYLMGATGGREGAWTSLFMKSSKGNVWREIFLNDVILRDAVFLDGGEIFATGSLFESGSENRVFSHGVLLHSIDGGLKWHLSLRSKEIESFVSVSIRPNKEILLIGEMGEILKLKIKSL